jgi:LuxR family maltose regulon positive regulatory protein
MKNANSPSRNPTFPSWLLRSKVSPTRQRVDLLDRPLLTQMLHQSLPGKLSLVHAPAGYGKTTLLSAWRRALLDEGHKVCWLSLDGQDNDPMQLLSYIAFAIHEGGLQFNASEGGVSFQIGDLSEREVLSLIIHSIAEAHERVVLILDEFETLGVEVVERVIHPILEYAPNNLHVSIATRIDSALRIARLEARGQAVRIDAHRLAFTVTDLKAILSDQCDAATMLRLFNLTQGWPVAIRMIRSACDIEATVAHMLNDAAFVASRLASYLADEVLRGIDQNSQKFLMDISLLDQVDCELADHLRERSDSHTLFQSLSLLDAFVQPVDSVRPTFRLHPLFREHLYAKIGMTAPARLKALQLRAADWFSNTGDVVEAVRRCVLAAEPAHAIALIAKAGGVMIYFKEGVSRLKVIMRLLPETSGSEDQHIVLIRCLLNLKIGRVATARQIMDSLSARGNWAGADEGKSSSSGMPAALVIDMVVSIVEGKTIPRAAREQTEANLSVLSAGEPGKKGLLLTVLFHGALQRGEFREAQRFAELAVPAFESAGAIYGFAYNHLHLGCVHFAQGDSQEAERQYRIGQNLGKKYFGDDHGLRLVANILIMELKYERGEAQGMALAARALPQLLEHHEVWFEIVAAGYTTFMGCAFDEQGIEAALAIIDGGVNHARRNELRAQEDFLTLLRVELYLRAGRIADARMLVNTAGFDCEQRLSSRQEFGWRQRDANIQVLARLLIAEGDARQALALLERHSANADVERHVKSCIRHLLLLVIAYRQLGDLAPMTRCLAAALTLSAHTGGVRAFLNEREQIEPAIRSYLSLQDEPGANQEAVQQARLILSRFFSAPVQSAPAQTAAGSMLSRTENRVLHELGSGFSNKLIARKIGVSESTVRFHLRNIFQKLKVRSRLEAVTMARQQNLLSA